MVLVCRPGHPLLALADPTPSDCLSYPIAAPILPQWYFDWLGRQVGDPTTPEGRDIYSYFLESDDLGVIRHIVQTTETISSMLPSVVAEDLTQGSLGAIRLKEMDFPIPAIICHTAGRPLAPAGEILLAEMVAQSARLREQTPAIS